MDGTADLFSSPPQHNIQPFLIYRIFIHEFTQKILCDVDEPSSIVRLNSAELGCIQNSVDTEFRRVFFSLPYNPYAVRNKQKFRGTKQHSVSRNSV
jgi:hypothetical protein